jgi:rRNA maturation RNase YbeY
MQINIENQDFPDSIDENALISVVNQLATMAQAESAETTPWCELTIYLLNDDSIAAIHKSIQSIDESTDVITQRYDAVPGEPEGLYGELFVNVQCALREGSSRVEWSPDLELALYIAHGCDHLNEYDDSTEEGYCSMRARELEWLKQLRLTSIIIKPII